MVELTNKCNMNCWFCPHSKMERAQGFMSVDTVELVIKKMKLMNQETAILQNIGESLLHPNFFEIVDMFDCFKTSVIVSGLSLNNENVEKLISSSLDTLKISVDFECDELLIRKLLKERNKETSLNFKGNTREKVIRLRKKWPEADVMYLNNFAGQMDFYNEVDSNICPFKELNSCVVLWDGRITPCCFDYEGKLVMGTLDEVEKLNQQGDYDLCNKCGGLY